MINFNGTLLENGTSVSVNNRGYAYGDALFETIKIVNGKILYWEDHYFRLMASMRIMRMEIPMQFTMEYLEKEIQKTLASNALQNNNARVKMIVHRNKGGFYLPKDNSVSYNIQTTKLKNATYSISNTKYEVDLFKDYFIAPTLLSTLKTNNKAINVLGSIYANENDLDNCLVLNTNKNVVEALNGNLFLIKGNTIKTPPLSDGCLKGIMRTEVLRIIEKLPNFSLEETTISPFELQKADELFITNVIVGIQPILKYRKKQFTTKTATLLLQRLNTKIRLT